MIKISGSSGIFLSNVPCRMIIVSIAIALLTGSWLFAGNNDFPSGNRYNILFIISDDMNDWIGCLGGHPDAITPNLDRLAERAVLFEQAHCSAPICNPSRASVMSGLNPSTTGCYGNRQALRMSPVGFEAVTLPRYFSNHGYYSTGVGKITHGKFPDPASWDDFYPNLRSQGMDGAEPLNKNTNGLNNESLDWGPLDVEDSEMKDGKITQHIIDMLGKNYDKPFFLAGGWKLPHLTWHAPRKYFEMYDPAIITLPLIKEDDLDDLPPKALRYTENSYYKSVTEAGKEREGVQAYLACISFIDTQVGRVLDALEKSECAENTIIVFWGDHGWHLGEKRHWSKSTLWEESTRAPMMIVAPGIKPGRCTTPVSFLDIYPTLVELAGLEPKRRGRKPNTKNPLADEVAKLQRENQSLKNKLRKAELVIDVQKKVSEMLDIPLNRPDDEGTS